jgi:hypothetical protein
MVHWSGLHPPPFSLVPVSKLFLSTVSNIALFRKIRLERCTLWSTLKLPHYVGRCCTVIRSIVAQQCFPSITSRPIVAEQFQQ